MRKKLKMTSKFALNKWLFQVSLIEMDFSSTLQ